MTKSGDFHLYQRSEAGLQISPNGTASLSLGNVLAPQSFNADRLRALAQKARHWIEDTEFVVDLGSRIGSREWMRGAATCFGLCAAALSLAPSFDPLPGANPAPLAPAQWEEARALTISPLAYGADTGRRMGATAAVEYLAETPDRPRIELTATLGRGDGFVRSLQRAGVSSAHAREAGDLVSDAISLGAIEAGTRMDLVLGRRASKRDARPLDKLAFRARLDLALAVERPEAGGALRLRRIPIAVDDTPLRVQGRVGGSLYSAARAAGAPAKAVEAYLRALGSRISVNRDVGSNDRFDLVVAQRRAETGEVEIGELLYAGLDRGKGKIQLVKWNSGGRSQWFEASGVGETRGTFQRPVVGRQTSSFGMRRHPLLGYSRFHKGIDFGAPSGTPIVAATDGVVSFAGWHGGHGRYVKLSHAGGFATAYAHMSRIAVSSGKRVRQGEVIGYVGSTGLSTGPHLHYEIYKNGAAVNPASVSFRTQTQLAGAELRRFKAALANYLAVRPGAEPSFARKSGSSEVARAEPTDTKSTRG